MSERKRKLGVFIGRFQPYTLAHNETVLKMQEEVDYTLILIGSPNVGVSIKNPFTFEERKNMIESMNYKNISILPIEDSSYNFLWWVSEVQRLVDLVKVNNGCSEVYLYGYIKDDSSFYLKHFPDYTFVDTGKIYKGLSATFVRNRMFESGKIEFVPDNVSYFLSEFLDTYRYSTLVSEYNFIKSYLKSWENSPYPPIFVTVDCLCLYKGKVLLVTRGCNPGKGLLALPGGFIEKRETLLESAIRELKEETSLGGKDITNMLKSVRVFDNPIRDLRGRFITHVHLFDLSKLKEIPKVKGGDDAKKADWYSLNDIKSMKSKFFSDHWSIIDNMLFVGEVK